MSWRIVCVGMIPDDDAYGWADGVLHSGTTLAELHQIAASFAWQRPLKISLPVGEEPMAWTILRSVWHDEYGMTAQDYQLRTLGGRPALGTA